MTRLAGIDRAARRDQVLLAVGGLTVGPCQITAVGMAARDASLDVDGWAALLDSMAQVVGAARLLYRVPDSFPEAYALAPQGWRRFRDLTRGDDQ